MRRISYAMLMLLSATAVRAEPVGLYCWIVGTTNEHGVYTYHLTAEAVSNMVDGVNAIYEQAVMSFAIQSINWTNDAYLAKQNADNIFHALDLCDIARRTGGLELYFVPTLTPSNTIAFHLRDGIVLGPRTTAQTLAHEIGHACGFRDIYCWHPDTPLTVEGPPTRARMLYDAGRYPADVTQCDVIRRLLMYGMEDSSLYEDIPYGDVYGLWYMNGWDETSGRFVEDWQLSLAPVGFHFHGNRHPQSD